jgi:hypothetical protein
MVPSGPHGFRVTTKIHPFWNLYLNGVGLAIAEANEPNRSSRAHSYRLSKEKPLFFDRLKSWRSYKEETIKDEMLETESCIVVQTDISSFYEHIYHHPLENRLQEICGNTSTIPVQIDRIISKLANGRSFGLPVGGQCARVLAEVMMTAIDQVLTEKSIVWHRYVDDFTLICKSQQDAYEALSVLTHTLADYGLSLNRSKTTFLSAKHYIDYIKAQLSDGDDASTALREIDLHFDPYSDTALDEYEKLKDSFRDIDVQFLLDLEKEKSQPDNFILTQIGRALKFQKPKTAAQLCSTLLDRKNLDAFRASWSKIMRGVSSVRSNKNFEEIFDVIDDLLDEIPTSVPHLLIPEANLLYFLAALRFKKTHKRGIFVSKMYDQSSSQSVKRACIYCWYKWEDLVNFERLKNKWSILSPGEQRMLWLFAKNSGDSGSHMQKQRKKATKWDLGFETKESKKTFTACYQDWVNRNVF